MILPFGKHAGKSTEIILLKHPDYALWILGKTDAYGWLAEAREEFLGLIGKFNSKPILTPCIDCGGQATRWSLYFHTINPYAWCEECDPTSRTPQSNKITIVRTYCNAASFVGSYDGTREHLKALILEMARGKGLPKRVGEREAEAFFRCSMNC